MFRVLLRGIWMSLHIFASAGVSLSSFADQVLVRLLSSAGICFGKEVLRRQGEQRKVQNKDLDRQISIYLSVKCYSWSLIKTTNETNTQKKSFLSS